MNRIVGWGVRAALVVGLLTASVAPVMAQGSAAISGVVKDATGAVLPGVTVEASSDALIEKTRSVASDGAGQYKIVALPPGLYTVSFSLSGFSTVKREGVALTTGFTAAVNADLRVGGVEETVSVTGAAPIVDVQNINRQVVMTRDVVETLPSGRSYAEVATLVPGVQYYNGGSTSTASTGSGGAVGVDAFASLAAHGGRAGDTYVELNGLILNVFSGQQSRSFMNLQDGNVQEYAMEFSANSAETETGGVRINMIPKEGGNRYVGSLFATVSGGSLQSSNFTDALRARGVRTPDSIKSLWTVNPSFGGPLAKDKVWFYAGYSRMVNERYKANAYFNSDIAAWQPVSDLSKRATSGELTHDASLRVTWQVSEKNKLSLLYVYNRLCQCPFGTGLFNGTIYTPEAASMSPRSGSVPQVNWTAPYTSRFLVEVAGAATRQSKGYDYYVTPKAPSIREATTGTAYRAPIYFNTGFYKDVNWTPQVKGSVSYVTGTHALKVGASYRMGWNSQTPVVYDNTTFNTVNYRPVSVTYYSTPFTTKADMRQAALFAQDQWTIRRMTLNLGLRYDAYQQGYPDMHLEPVQYVPVARDFPGATLVSWSDLSPRAGVAFDLFGNGKTAVKASVSRYVIQQGLLQNPVRSNVSMTRVWTDPNGDFIVQGDPLNPAANGELGVSQNRLFGTPVLANRYDPDYATGFGNRSYNWESSASVQHQLASGVALNVGYFRRWYGNFEVTDNLAIGAADFDPYCVTTPSDARLPNGGAQQICGLYDLKPAKVGQINNIITSSAKYGKQTERWDGVDVAVQTRLTKGVMLQGGVSTGRTTSNNCEIVANLDNPSPLYCTQATPMLTQVKLGASFTLPWQIEASGTFQSFNGPALTASATFTNAQVAPALGRNLSSGATATVNLVQPGMLYGDQINQVDLRIARNIVIGRARIKAMFDMYNVGNINTPLQLNSAYGTNGSSWLVPTSLSYPRLVKFSAQVNF